MIGYVTECIESFFSIEPAGSTPAAGNGSNELRLLSITGFETVIRFREMTEPPLRILCVIGTSAAKSATHTVVGHIARRLRTLGADLDVFDPSKEPLLLFNPESSYLAHQFLQLKERVEQADVYVLGTPDYHGSISSTLKNFLDHFWQEFTGKLFAQVVCSHEKGLTVIDQLRTVARQCYAWTLPYGLSFTNSTDLQRWRGYHSSSR